MKRKKVSRKRGTRILQRERITDAGCYRTVRIYPVFGGAKKGKRGRRRKPSSEVQELLNQKNREEELNQKILANFDENDLEIGLGFWDEFLPEDYNGALRLLQNFLRRVKYYRKKNNLGELKYIACIEKGEKNGRWHYHIILNGGIDRDKLEELWGMGYAHTYRLEFDEEGIKGLAKYTVKETETEAARVDGKVHRYLCSRNLKKPGVKERDGRVSRKTVTKIRTGVISEREIEKMYPGYYVSRIEPYYNEVNGGEYVTIRMYKKDINIKRKRRAVI